MRHEHSAPEIVSYQEFLSQTAVFGPTPIFTPQEDGLFRVSMYLETGSTDGTTSVGGNVSWTDDFRPNAPAGFTFSLIGYPGFSGEGAGYGQTTVVIRAKARTSITVATTTSGTLASPYNLYVTVEAL